MKREQLTNVETVAPAALLPEREVVEFRDRYISVDWEYAQAFLSSANGIDLTTAYDEFRRELEAERKALILKACNAHDNLVAALRECESMLAEDYDDEDPVGCEGRRILLNARAALAKAGL